MCYTSLWSFMCTQSIKAKSAIFSQSNKLGTVPKPVKGQNRKHSIAYTYSFHVRCSHVSQSSYSNFSFI